MAQLTATLAIGAPYSPFIDPYTFRPVFNGFIYIGSVDKDPTDPLNRIPVSVEEEDGSLIEVSQPLRTNAAGFPVYNGKVVKFVTGSTFSMVVLSSLGVQLFYIPNVYKLNPTQGIYQFAGAYENGPLRLDSYQNTITYNGSVYLIKPGGPLPFLTTGTTAATWAVDKSSFILLDGDAWRPELISQAIGKGDSYIKHELNPVYGNSITLNNYVGRFISLEAFYFATDNGDYGPAITRASQRSAADGVAIRVDKMYLIKSRPDMASNCVFIGLGRFTGLYCADDVPFTLLYAVDKENITVQNMFINGGVTPAATAKNYTRGVRFIRCKNLTVNMVWTTRFADWGISFEACDGVRVFDIVHFGGGLGRAGGRDGVHFLNCDNVDCYDCDVESGDDCVAATVEGGHNSVNLTFRNIRGISDIASIVTIGFESDLSGTFDNLTIDNVYPKVAGGTRYIVQCRGAAANGIKKATITNIRGTSFLFGLFLQYIQKLTLRDIDTLSQTQHGLIVSNCNEVTGSDVRGNALAATYNGLQFVNVGYAALSRIFSDGAPTYGAQFLTCGTVYVDGARLRESGNSPFRVVDTARVRFEGEATTTVGAYGIQRQGNAYFKEDPGSLVSGVTAPYNSIPGNGVSDEAYAYGDITQDSATTISSASVYTSSRMTVTAVATGQIDIAFPIGMRTNRYGVTVQPYGANQRRHRVGAKTNNGFSIFFDDFSGNAANASFYVEIKASGGANV